MIGTLSVEPNLIDPDVGADPRRGWIDVCTTVEARQAHCGQDWWRSASLLAMRMPPRRDGKLT
jgi:hypothetical protein